MRKRRDEEKRIKVRRWRGRGREAEDVGGGGGGEGREEEEVEGQKGVREGQGWRRECRSEGVDGGKARLDEEVKDIMESEG